MDFSSSSFQVLAHAAKLAAAMEQALIAVHVTNESRLLDSMDRRPAYQIDLAGGPVLAL